MFCKRLPEKHTPVCLFKKYGTHVCICPSITLCHTHLIPCITLARSPESKPHIATRPHLATPMCLKLPHPCELVHQLATPTWTHAALCHTHLNPCLMTMYVSKPSAALMQILEWTAQSRVGSQRLSLVSMRRKMASWSVTRRSRVCTSEWIFSMDLAWGSGGRGGRGGRKVGEGGRGGREGWEGEGEGCRILYMLHTIIMYIIGARHNCLYLSSLIPLTYTIFVPVYLSFCSYLYLYSYTLTPIQLFPVSGPCYTDYQHVHACNEIYPISFRLLRFQLWLRWDGLWSCYSLTMLFLVISSGPFGLFNLTGPFGLFNFCIGPFGLLNSCSNF